MINKVTAMPGLLKRGGWGRVGGPLAGEGGEAAQGDGVSSEPFPQPRLSGEMRCDEIYNGPDAMRCDGCCAAGPDDATRCDGIAMLAPTMRWNAMAVGDGQVM